VKKSHLTNYDCQLFTNTKGVMSTVDSQFIESKDFLNVANVSNLFFEVKFIFIFCKFAVFIKKGKNNEQKS